MQRKLRYGFKGDEVRELVTGKVVKDFPSDRRHRRELVNTVVMAVGLVLVIVIYLGIEICASLAGALPLCACRMHIRTIFFAHFAARYLFSGKDIVARVVAGIASGVSIFMLNTL